MADRKTFWTNAWEATAPGGWASTGTLLSVSDASALQTPCYIIVEPDDPAQREVVYVSSKSGNDLTVSERYLQGSAAGSGLTHPADSVVRAAALAQGFTDLHDRVDANDVLIAANDPSGVYLPLGGGSMAGAIDMASTYQITNLPAPTLAGHAARKSYVDGLLTTHEGAADPHAGYVLNAELTSAISDHEAAANPHPTYLTQAEGDALYAAISDALLLSGGTMTGPLNMGGQTLLAPADPTLGTHVGDRDYNDARYLGVTAKAADANLLDGLNSSQFLRSGTSDSFTGATLTVGGNLNLTSVNDRFLSAGNFHLWNETNQAPDRYWMEMPNGTNFYLGPRSGADTLLAAYIRAATTVFSGRVEVPEGSASSPSIYSAEASNDTGIYFDHGLNRIGFAVDGNASNVILSSQSFSRVGTTTLDLGSSSFRWDTIWLIASPDVSSDESLKENITRQDNGFLDVVRAVRPASFTRRGNGRAERGFIANDFDPVDPSLSHMNENGERSVRTLELISTAWGAVRELAAENDELRARIEVLENA